MSATCHQRVLTKGSRQSISRSTALDDFVTSIKVPLLCACGHVTPNPKLGMSPQIQEFGPKISQDMKRFPYLSRDILSYIGISCPWSIAGLSHVQTFPVQPNVVSNTKCSREFASIQQIQPDWCGRANCASSPTLLSKKVYCFLPARPPPLFAQGKA